MEGFQPALEVLGEALRDAAQRHAVHADVLSAAAVGDFMDRLRRDGDLHHLALSLARYDLEQAGGYAREIEGVTWWPDDYDR